MNIQLTDIIIKENDALRFRDMSGRVINISCDVNCRKDSSLKIPILPPGLYKISVNYNVIKFIELIKKVSIFARPGKVNITINQELYVGDLIIRNSNDEYIGMNDISIFRNVTHLTVVFSNFSYEQAGEYKIYANYYQIYLIDIAIVLKVHKAVIYEDYYQIVTFQDDVENISFINNEHIKSYAIDGKKVRLRFKINKTLEKQVLYIRSNYEIQLVNITTRNVNIKQGNEINVSVSKYNLTHITCKLRQFLYRSHGESILELSVNHTKLVIEVQWIDLKVVRLGKNLYHSLSVEKEKLFWRYQNGNNTKDIPSQIGWKIDKDIAFIEIISLKKYDSGLYTLLSETNKNNPIEQLRLIVLGERQSFWTEYGKSFEYKWDALDYLLEFQYLLSSLIVKLNNRVINSGITHVFDNKTIVFKIDEVYMNHMGLYDIYFENIHIIEFGLIVQDAERIYERILQRQINEGGVNIHQPCMNEIRNEIYRDFYFLKENDRIFVNHPSQCKIGPSDLDHYLQVYTLNNLFLDYSRNFAGSYNITCTNYTKIIKFYTLTNTIDKTVLEKEAFDITLYFSSNITSLTIYNGDQIIQLNHEINNQNITINELATMTTGFYYVANDKEVQKINLRVITHFIVTKDEHGYRLNINLTKWLFPEQNHEFIRLEETNNNSNQIKFQIDGKIKISDKDKLKDDVHRFAVSNVKISVDTNPNSTKNNAPNQYSVLVSFKSPRGSKELLKKYHIFIYKVWRITNGNAALVAIDKIKGNQFSVPRLEEDKFYFVRIFTIINNAYMENYSTLKFFTNDNLRPTNPFRVFDHYPSIPAFELQTLMKHLPNMSYSLALKLDTSIPRNEIDFFMLIVEKNNRMVERRHLEKVKN
ncbi:unnamed protein product [Gordionus sp. m RMFG-2023]